MNALYGRLYCLLYCRNDKAHNKHTKHTQKKKNRKRIKNKTFVLSSLKGLRQTLLREELVSRLRITTIPKNNTSFEICECASECERIDTQQSQSNELNEHCRYIHNLPLKIIIINTRLCAAQCEGGWAEAWQAN